MIPFGIFTRIVLDTGVVRVDFKNINWVDNGDGTWSYSIPRRLHKSGVHPRVQFVDNSTHIRQNVGVSFSFQGIVTFNSIAPVSNFTCYFYGDNTESEYPAPPTGITNLSLSYTNGAFIKDTELYIGGDTNHGLVGVADFYPSTHAFYNTKITDAVEVYCGDNFIVIKKTNGSYYGKGDNTKGQLGLTENTVILDWTQLPIPTDITKLEVSNNNMAYSLNGNLYVCGLSTHGIYGVGSTVQQYGFVQSNISDVADFSIGLGHIIVLKNDTTVWAVGRNSSYQLGIGISSAGNFPTFTQCVMNGAPLSNVTHVKASEFNSIIQLSDNNIYAVGWNESNMCGFIPPGSSSTLNWSKVANGYDVGIDDVNLSFNCGYYNINGAWYGAGTNAYGQLATGDNKEYTTLTPLPDLYMCTPSEYSLLYVDRNENTVIACGNNNRNQLGFDSTTPIITPTAVSIATSTYSQFQIKCATQIPGKTFLLTTDNKLYSSGMTVTGFPSSDTYVEFNHNIPSEIKEIKCGYYRASHNTPFVLYALCVNGDVWCIGDNTKNQFGIPDIVTSTTFIKLPISNIKKIAIGYTHAMALTTDNKLYMCGDNYYYQQGYQDYSTPRKTWELIPNFDVIDIAAGSYYSMLLLSSGEIRNCGYNVEYQLGRTTSRYEWLAPAMAVPATNIFASHYESFYKSNDNNLYGCGWNDNGVLKTGGVVQSFSQIDPDVLDLSVGSVGISGVIFEKTSSDSYFRGCNTTGVFGDGTTSSSRDNQITTYDISNIWLGNSSIFTDANNVAWSAGQNTSNELGYGNGVDYIKIYYKSTQ